MRLPALALAVLACLLVCPLHAIAQGTATNPAADGELPARLSRSAGNYLCNYLLWHATRAARRPNGPSLAAFIHVPPLSKRVTMERLAVSGEAILLAAARSLRRH